MSLKSECEASIYSFAPLHKQLNSQILGEYSEYVGMVILLHREEYQVQKANGDSTFVLSESAKEILTEQNPF
tara:strand:+ start:14702 stop:14917 length:216 start_codon:yes stop_codon:yes gene_type:complete